MRIDINNFTISIGARSDIVNIRTKDDLNNKSIIIKLKFSYDRLTNKVKDIIKDGLECVEVVAKKKIDNKEIMVEYIVEDKLYYFIFNDYNWAYEFRKVKKSYIKEIDSINIEASNL